MEALVCCKGSGRGDGTLTCLLGPSCRPEAILMQEALTLWLSLMQQPAFPWPRTQG